MRKKRIIVKQHDATDCGAACLASVAAVYGLFLPISVIRQYCGTGHSGTTALGMIEAAEKMGFSAKGVKAGKEALHHIPYPAIAHVILPNGWNHYVVIRKYKKDKIVYMDPGPGKMEKQSIEEFGKIWTGVLILLQPSEKFSPGNHIRSVWKRFFQLTRPHSSIMFQAVAGALIFTVLGLSTSVYVQKIVDVVLAEGNLQLLNLMSVIMIILLIFQITIGYFKSLFILKTGQHIDARLILGYYRHIQQLPQQFFDTMRVGEIMSRVGDAVKIRAFINESAIGITVNIFTIVCSFILMCIFNIKLAFIMALILPFFIASFIVSHHMSKKWQRKLMVQNAELESQLVENLSSAGAIRQLGLEEQFYYKVESRFIRLLRIIYTFSVQSLQLGNSSEFIMRLFTIIILWCGSYFVVHRELTPGELLSFYALIGYFTSPALYLIGANKMIQDALIAAERLYEILDLNTEDDSMALPGISFTGEGNIQLEKISFGYPGAPLLFQNLSCIIPLQKISAITGESGCGKSTFFSLLQNLYPVKNGRILIEDKEIHMIPFKILRNHIGAVPQKPVVFSGTIAENIMMGAIPDYDKMVSICKRLGIHDFFATLPSGYHTSLGERGMNLSGGQMQRLSIARTLFREPEILILDEPSSALDDLAESRLADTLLWYKEQGKTIILITHRKGLISCCDHVFRLENGRLLEETLQEYQG